MTRIAVICAYNRRNSGMYSVDLAARQFFGALGLAHDLCVTQRQPAVGSLRYRVLRSVDELRGYDTIVYWGDFLNNPMWGRHDYALREVSRNQVATLEQAFDNWRRLYLLEEAALPASTRVLALGGCFIGMGSALTTAPVAASLRQFVDRCAAVVVRDPASFELLSGFAGGSSQLSLGFDCATLMRSRGPTRWRGPYFTYSFGRSLTTGDAAALVRHTERQTGLRGIAINWLYTGERTRLRHSRFVARLALMRHARFNLTDTYHFAMNSLTQGSLPLCVVRDEPATPSTLNELKKATLFRMVGLGYALLHLPGESRQPVADAALQAAAQRVADTVDNVGAGDGWRAGFVQQQRQFRDQTRRLFV